MTANIQNTYKQSTLEQSSTKSISLLFLFLVTFRREKKIEKFCYTSNSKSLLPAHCSPDAHLCRRRLLNLGLQIEKNK